MSGDAGPPLSPEDGVDPGEDEVDLGLRNARDSRFEQRPVQSADLRDVGDRVLRQSRQPLGQPDVAGGVSPAQIAGQGYADDCSYSTSVQGVALDDDYRPAKPWSRSRRFGQFSPADVALADHHSTRRRARCAAAARKASSCSPRESQTRSISSVTSSGAWRATYSSRAAAYTSLRDRPACRARSSARAKMSSGIETAVFIPGV